MMSNYRNREFEQYVKENADQYRMFPSEKVWKNINSILHTRRKWYAIGLASLLLITGTAVTLVMVSYPSSKKQEVTSLKTTAQTNISHSPADESIISKSILPFNGQIADQFTPLFTDPVINKAIRVKNPQEAEVNIFEQEHIAVNEREQIFIVDRNITDVFQNENKSYTSIIDDDFSVIPESDIPAGKYDNALVANDPLTIESVTNAYQPKKLGKKLSWQFFISPTVSYRKLSTNESFDNSTLNYPFTSLTDVNSAVIHKPDIGLQIGTSFQYPLTKSLRLRGGLQFNINRYDIKAYTYNPEVATIRLNNPNGSSSVWTWTNYRNYNGYKSNWLKNYYFSVSIPVGAEMKLLGNDKTSFGIAGTIQPTYIIKDKAYLISTDYKNYAKVPSLVRHVNANASFEAFVNYSNGKTRWQIGPQVRYQLLSSFQKKYPVEEHLFDFGLKVGVFLNEK